MRTSLVGIVAATCLAAGVGCSGRQSAPASFEHLAGRNLTQEPIRWLDDQQFKKIAYRHAEEAWDALGLRKTASKDYHDGFVEGFVDYLDAGGNGEPPVAPPFRYRLTFYKNPWGQEATADWFAGFRHGAAVARRSGLRAQVVVPLSAPILQAAEPQSSVPLSAQSHQGPQLPPPQEVGPADRLPPPREDAPPPERLPPPKSEPADNARNTAEPPRLPPSFTAPAHGGVRLVGGVQ
jgi:hypothetical protein